MELRERKKALLRGAMVRNALALFQERGFDAVSLDEIVAASMCSRSTFHRYFGTKEDLLFPTADERLRILEANLRTADPSEDLWTVARREVTAGLTGFLDDFEPDLRPQCISLWFSEPSPRRRYLEIVVEWEKVLTEFLEPHMRPSPTQRLELQLLGSAITSALRAALNTAMETGEDVGELIDRAFDLIESGVSANLMTLRHQVG